MSGRARPGRSPSPPGRPRSVRDRLAGDTPASRAISASDRPRVTRSARNTAPRGDWPRVSMLLRRIRLGSYCNYHNFSEPRATVLETPPGGRTRASVQRGSERGSDGIVTMDQGKCHALDDEHIAWEGQCPTQPPRIPEPPATTIGHESHAPRPGFAALSARLEPLTWGHKQAHEDTVGALMKRCQRPLTPRRCAHRRTLRCTPRTVRSCSTTGHTYGWQRYVG